MPQTIPSGGRGKSSNAANSAEPRHYFFGHDNGWKVSTGLVAAQVAIIAVIVLLASSVPLNSVQSARASGLTLESAPAPNDPPPVVTGDTVGFSCPFGTITLASTQDCKDGSSSHDVCATDPSCADSLAATMNSGGPTFNRWVASGDAYVTCSTCATTTATFYWSSGSDSGSLKECPALPSISSVSISPYHSFEDIWINWTDTSATSTVFQWGTSTSYGSPAPEAQGTSIRLNALNSSTTYYYKITDSDNCDTSSPYTNSYTTSSVSTSNLLGWVFAKTLVQSPYVNLPTGTPINGAVVYVEAICPTEDSSEYVNFTATTSGGAPWNDGNGFYVLGFPISAVDINDNGYYSFWNLTAGGSCEGSGYYHSDAGPWGPYFRSNSEYLLGAEAQGYWNETRMVSATMSSVGDYQEFAITLDPQGTATLGLALLDDSSSEEGVLPPTECSFDLDAGVSTSVEDNFGGNGATSTYGGETTWGASYGGWGVDTGVDAQWLIGGTLNDSQPTNILSSAYPIEYASSWSPSPSTTSDWVTIPAYTGQTAGTYPWTMVYFPSSYTKASPDTFLTLTSTTSFTSSAGLEIDVDVGVSFGLVDTGISVPLTYTTTVTHSSTSTMTCQAYDPSSTADSVLWYYEDYSQASQSDVLHMAFMGYCGSGTSYSCT
jgi:hypothetical protein